ncbi:unnamed protein product [Sphenostylis stenocarpa]|uniref:Oleosin n=1 Tax=Sphenostylis stenocarpa TaxID=92480 RepID=A0AA86SIJ0_9FABA|nr:unnamed protein product [Sphenostylis stenocarpa]
MDEVGSLPHHGQVHANTTQHYDGFKPTSQHRHHQGGTTPHRGGEGGVIMSLIPETPLTGTQLLLILVGLPFGGTLLLLSSVSFMASLGGLAVITPLLILFSPVLVPAAVVIGLAAAGVLVACACGLVGLASFSWVVSYVQQMLISCRTSVLPEHLGAARGGHGGVRGAEYSDKGTRSEKNTNDTMSS